MGKSDSSGLSRYHVGATSGESQRRAGQSTAVIVDESVAGDRHAGPTTAGVRERTPRARTGSKAGHENNLFEPRLHDRGRDAGKGERKDLGGVDADDVV